MIRAEPEGNMGSGRAHRAALVGAAAALGSAGRSERDPWVAVAIVLGRVCSLEK